MKPTATYQLLAVLLLQSFQLQAQCPESRVDQDVEVWQRLGCQGRTYFSWYFELREADWDEGWGWEKCDPAIWDGSIAADWPLPKMLNAATLLSLGFEPPSLDVHESLFPITAWSAENLTTKALDIGDAYLITRDSRAYQPTGIYNSDGSFEIFGVNRYATGEVIRYAGVRSGQDWTAENLTRNYGPAGSVLEMGYHPVPLMVSGNGGTTLFLFGVSGQSAMLAYERSPADDWQLHDLTAQVTDGARYKVRHRPTTLNYPLGIPRVFATNTRGEVVEYVKRLGGWQASNLTETASGTGNHVIQRNLSSTLCEQLDLYGQNDNDELIHYFSTGYAGWSAENITLERIEDGAAYRLNRFSRPVTVCAPRPYSRRVFGINSAGDLIQYAQYRDADWTAENVTLDSPAIGTSFRFDHRSNPAAFVGYGNVINVFGLNGTNDLLHYQWSPGSGWIALNVTDASPHVGERDRLLGNLVALQGAFDSIHVYAQNAFGNFYHYYRSPTTEWRADDITTRTSIGIEYNSTTEPVILADDRGHHHAFSVNRGDEVIHYHVSEPAHPWHTNTDYSFWASGSAQGFTYQPSTEDDDVATALGGFWQEDRVEMECPSFRGDFDTKPAGRASAMLHEATHLIYWRWSHVPHPDDLCDGDCADLWLAHGLRDIRPGELRPHQDRHKHSMTQIQVEYLCDLAEFPAPWVPASVLMNSASLGGLYLDSRIINPPGWRCGSPRPLN